MRGLSRNIVKMEYHNFQLFCLQVYILLVPDDADSYRFLAYSVADKKIDGTIAVTMAGKYKIFLGAFSSRGYGVTRMVVGGRKSF